MTLALLNWHEPELVRKSMLSKVRRILKKELGLAGLAGLPKGAR